MSTSREAAAVVLSIGGSRHLLEPATTLTIGRSEDADIRIEDPRVSREHASIHHLGESCVVTDLGSRRGTLIDGEQISGPAVVSPPALIQLGPGDGPTLRLTTADGAPAVTGISLQQPGHTVVIGRGEECDVVVDDLLVSRRHVRVTRLEGTCLVEDLSSRNGTYLNGAPVVRAEVGPGDELTIGRHTFRLGDDGWQARADDGDISFVVDSLTYTLPSGKTLLDDVSFALPGSSVLAVVGPSGAGKSTLLGALTGSQPATSGQVRYDGRDMYQHLSQLQHRIGVVPQDDVVHHQLTVRQALRYAAELRFPEDLDAGTRAARVDEVIAELGLTEHRDTRVAKLSGGQRKRTSVALELLTQPSLLFLDEPTSGLDPGRDQQVMQTVRELADGGRTVMIITHSTDNLDLCDRVLFLAPGGRVAYFGEPAGLLEHFGATKYAEAFRMTEDHPEAVAERFRSSPVHETQIREPLDRANRRAPVLHADPDPRQQSLGRQFSTLVRRHLSVLLADRLYLGFLLVVPVLLALLALVVPGDHGLGVPAAGEPPTGQPTQILVILTVGAVFIGLSMGIRELVSERALYVRERAVGLSPRMYLLAKLAVLTAVIVLQGAAMTAVTLSFREGPAAAVLLGSPALELAIALILCATASLAMGLCLSALVRTAAQFMPIVVVVVMTQLVLSGGLFPVDGRPALEVAALAAPARWAFAAAAGTVDLNRTVAREPDPLWDHEPLTWLVNITMLIILTALFSLLAWWRLQRPYRLR